jgi:hypothetical protein
LVAIPADDALALTPVATARARRMTMVLLQLGLMTFALALMWPGGPARYDEHVPDDRERLHEPEPLPAARVVAGRGLLRASAVPRAEPLRAALSSAP